MKKILTAAALILMTVFIVYAAARSYPKVHDECLLEGEQKPVK